MRLTKDKQDVPRMSYAPTSEVSKVRAGAYARFPRKQDSCGGFFWAELEEKEDSGEKIEMNEEE